MTVIETPIGHKRRFESGTLTFIGEKNVAENKVTLRDLSGKDFAIPANTSFALLGAYSAILSAFNAWVLD